MMPTTRRRFLKVGLTGAAAISMAGSVPGFVKDFAFAEQPGPASDKVANDNILVVVQLTGGNDGLNTLIPYTDDAYVRARPKLTLHKTHLKLTDRFGLHPSMFGLKDLFDRGQLAVVNGCGYPNPSRSHFRSMEVWHTASPAETRVHGWLGHWLDHHARGGTGPTGALNIGAELPQALVNEGAPVPSVQDLSDFSLRVREGSADERTVRDLLRQLNAERAGTADASPARRFLARQATNAIVSTEKIKDAAARANPGAWYGGDPVGQQLQMIANLIGAGAGNRLYYAQTNGYDTHASQLDSHATLLGGLSQAISAFHQSLTALGMNDKVVVMCFSEFGRRVHENSSQGTDHGAAAPVLISGGKVKAGIHGVAPSLKDLDDDDLKHTTDFRQVYATLLDRWLNADSAKVLGAKFEPVAFL